MLPSILQSRSRKDEVVSELLCSRPLSSVVAHFLTLRHSAAETVVRLFSLARIRHSSTYRDGMGFQRTPNP